MTQTAEELVSERAAEFYNDPLGFVYWAFPWGVPGTPLASPPFDCPDPWQEDFLGELGEWCKKGQDGAFWFAVASGHGIGKGAAMAMATLWFANTRYQGRGQITASTGDQLRGKTWAELAFWHRMSVTKDCYEWAAQRYSRIGFKDTWFIDALTWNEKAPDAFGGLHAKDVFMGFDEASGIADSIWEAGQGSMSTPGAIWVVLGNPLNNTGRFRECFYRFKNRWRRKQIDSRQSKFADKKWANDTIADYGEDSDISRVRVKGEFPRSSAIQFFSIEDIETAVERNHGPEVYSGHAKILGVDVARAGVNASVIAKRQGYKVWPLAKYPGDMDGPTLAMLVKEVADEFRPDGICVDATGVGWSCYDYLVKLGIKNVFAIQVGDQDHNRVDREKYFNLRAQAYSLFKQSVLDNLDLPDDQDLKNEMEAMEFGWAGSKDLIQMAKKDPTNSPDCADSIMLTFARKILPKRSGNGRNRPDTRYIV